MNIEAEKDGKILEQLISLIREEPVPAEKVRSVLYAAGITDYDSWIEGVKGVKYLPAGYNPLGRDVYVDGSKIYFDWYWERVNSSSRVDCLARAMIRLGLDGSTGGIVRIEMLSLVLREFKINGFVVFPKADKAFNSLVGCCFKDFMGKRPKDIAVDKNKILSIGSCAWRWRDGKVLEVMGEVKGAPVVQHMYNAQTDSSAIIHPWGMELEKEMHSKVLSCLPEEIDFKAYAAKYRIDYHVVMMCYLREFGKVMKSNLVDGASDWARERPSRQYSGGQLTQSEKGGGAVATGDVGAEKGRSIIKGSMRVFDLAKELGVSDDFVLRMASEAGVDVWSSISILDFDAVEAIKRKISKETLLVAQKDRAQKLQVKALRLKDLNEEDAKTNNAKLEDSLRVAKDVWEKKHESGENENPIEIVGNGPSVRMNENLTNAQSRIVKSECGWIAQEIDFLKSFENYVRESGFKYESADLVRLHTSVKCFMCTLLAGDPGTGKSSLAELYMRALAGREGVGKNPFKVFVNPAWMEPADMLGYENVDEEGNFDFVPAPSHFVDFIREPITEESPVRIACFEEINLACVEHYFSDFVQIISRRGGDLPGCRTAKGEPDLKISGDFRIIGTLNSDETTHPLSPRFLSRCNGIELQCRDEMVDGMLSDVVEGKTTAAPIVSYPSFGGEVTNGKFSQWREFSEKRVVDYRLITETLRKLYERDSAGESLLSSAGLSLTGRTVADLFTYVRNRPPYNSAGNFFSEDERQRIALDEFLAQRLFFAVNPTPGTFTGIERLAEKLKKVNVRMRAQPLVLQGGKRDAQMVERDEDGVVCLNRSSCTLSTKVRKFKALTGML